MHVSLNTQGCPILFLHGCTQTCTHCGHMCMSHPSACPMHWTEGAHALLFVCICTSSTGLSHPFAWLHGNECTCVALITCAKKPSSCPTPWPEVYMYQCVYEWPPDSPCLPQPLYIVVCKHTQTCVHAAATPHLVPHFGQKVYMHQYMYVHLTPRSSPPFHIVVHKCTPLCGHQCMSWPPLILSHSLVEVYMHE